MKTQQIVIGSLVAGVSFFFLGWLIYGIVLNDYMAANSDTSGSRPMEEMVWWALILSNLIWGLFLTLILDWSRSTGITTGAKVGAFTGLLTGLGFDLSTYSMTTTYSNVSVIFVDVVCSAFYVCCLRRPCHTGYRKKVRSCQLIQ